jgi:uncharacterized integral membrane protein
LALPFQPKRDGRDKPGHDDRQAGFMVRNIIAALVLIPLAVIIVLLAVANRQAVTISLDPFMAEPRVLAVSQPLFVVILSTLIAGVVIGGMASWLRQSKWRRTARRAQAEVRALRAEADALRQRLDSAERPGPHVGSIAYRRPPAA